MKYLATAHVLLIIIISTMFACSKKTGYPQVIPGYINPGDFRPLGVAPEKTYSFPSFPVPQTCGPGPQCVAVYTYWWTPDKEVTEGIAVNDTHNTNPSFSMKIFRKAGVPVWNVNAIINGKSYVGIIDLTQDAAAMTISRSQSSEFILPAYIAVDGTALAEGGSNMNIVTIKFNNPDVLNRRICTTIDATDCLTFTACDPVSGIPPCDTIIAANCSAL